MARSIESVRAALALVAVGAALATAAPASSQVTCGATVATSAALTADLACDASTAPAVTVEGGGRLDLAGHTIRCTAGMNPGVWINGSGASVQNGAIQGCSTGLYAVGNANRIHEVVVQFAATTTYGIRILGDDNVVRRCAVRDALGNTFVVAGNRNRLGRNVSVGGGEAAFKVDIGNDNVLVDNIAYFANFNGFLTGQDTRRTVLEDNVAVLGQIGFYIGGDKQVIANNLTIDQQLGGFTTPFDAVGNDLRYNTSVFSFSGFDIVGASSVLRNNAAFGNDHEGFVVRGPSNRAKQNLAIGNQLDVSDTSGCQNVWSGNSFATADAACIH